MSNRVTLPSDFFMKLDIIREIKNIKITIFSIRHFFDIIKSMKCSFICSILWD